jgi:C4-dicarboxylate transporter DctQ subunit
MKKLGKIFAHGEELLLGWLLLSMAVIAFIQVVMRYFFHSGFAWGEEINRYLCILMTFMGAALCVKRGTHFSMDALHRILPESGQKILAHLVHLLTAIIYATVTWYSVIQIMRLARYNSHSPAMQIPMVIPYLIIPLFSSLMTFRSLIKAWHGNSVSATVFTPAEPKKTEPATPKPENQKTVKPTSDRPKVRS